MPRRNQDSKSERSKVSVWRSDRELPTDPSTCDAPVTPGDNPVTQTESADIEETVLADRQNSSNRLIAGVQMPSLLGSVRLIEEIGKGGMGVVWRGHDVALDRPVAVKFLLRGVKHCGDEEFANFLDGTRAAAKIQHPGLTTIYHADRVGGLPYLIMEYVDGVSLHDLLKQRGSLPFDEVFEIMNLVCGAVSALHDKHVLHRDIKPANVLIDRDGRICVTDFGLSSAWGWGMGQDTAAGTPPYMAAEVFEGTSTPRSDVYALGMMTYELLTGILPFVGSQESIRQQHEESPVPTYPLSLADIEPQVIDVILRAVHKSHMLRHKSAKRFCEALAVAANRKPINDANHRLPEILSDLPTSTETQPKRIHQESGDSSTYYEMMEKRSANRKRRRVGRESEQTFPSPDVEITDESNTGIRADIECVKCCYNLRSLTPSGHCPECGEEVASSINPDRLIFADADWLSGYSHSLTWVYRMSLIAPVVIGGGLLAERSGLLLPRSLTRFLSLVAFAIWGAFLFTAIYVLFRAAPKQDEGPSRNKKSRKIPGPVGVLRILISKISPHGRFLSGVFVSGSFVYALYFLGDVLEVNPWLQPILVGAIVLIFDTALVSIAKRIPEFYVLRRSRPVSWLTIAATIGCLFFGYCVKYGGPYRSAISEIIIAAAIIAIGSVALLLFAYLVECVRRVRKGVNRAIARNVKYEFAIPDAEELEEGDRDEHV